MAWFGESQEELCCIACGASSSSWRCSRCKVPYCSAECQQGNWKKHRELCAGKSDLRPELRVQNLAGWKAFNFRGDQLVKLKHRECFGLALLEALEKMPANWRLKPINGRCVVWILGARDGIEKRQVLEGGWHRLLSSLDVGWDIVLIGPEMEEDKAVLVHNGTRVYTFSVMFHDAELPDHLQRPSFVCAFNSGLGASVPLHMKSWIPTLVQLLSHGWPLLLTCFGLHEARLEASLLEALEADFTRHAEGSFGHVLEADKPLSVCNAMFSWVRGSKLEKEQLLVAQDSVQKQLEACQLFQFMKEVRSHILILSDPNGSAHVGWAEMYDGRFIPALKTALEEDDDENGGIQQIVRCAMKTVVAACEVPCAARLFRYLGLEALKRFKHWAETKAWTKHQWVSDEVLGWVDSAFQWMQQTPAFASLEAMSEDQMEIPFNARLEVRRPCELLREPCRTSRVETRLGKGQTLHAQALKGLWVRVQFRESSCWLHGYSETDGHACDITYWDFTRLSFPNKKWALRMVSPACLFPAVYYQETSEIIQKLLCILVLKKRRFLWG
ncbi:unnamed protein product [Cladocopium goreaui]|uniref:MYND-type domain-containing protein n=1 Tax=Cladocopium goreaui TaxID=2562237 RepID=A0A9P1FMV1_9DINO|nr:unnamed protein product [Cladocopium goreaui]